MVNVSSTMHILLFKIILISMCGVCRIYAGIDEDTQEEKIDVEELQKKLQAMKFDTPFQSLGLDVQNLRVNKAVQRYHDWLDSCGVERLADVAPAPALGLGLVATEAISRHQIFGQVPLNCTMSVEGAEATEHLGPVLRFMRENLKWDKGRAFGQEPMVGNEDTVIALMVIVFAERCQKSNSFYAPYLSLLPKTFDTPFYWNAKEMSAIRHTELQRLIREQERVRDLFLGGLKGIAEAFPKLFPRKYVTSKNLLWAYTVVDSRFVPVENMPGGFKGALVPFADMANQIGFRPLMYHLEGGRVHPNQYSRRAGLIELRAEANFKVGQPVVASQYRSNSELLKSHGFVIEDNANDETGIYMQNTYKELIGKEETRENLDRDRWFERVAILEKLGYPSGVKGPITRYSFGPGWIETMFGATISKSLMEKTGDRWVDPRLFRSLRVALAPFEKLQKRFKMDSGLKEPLATPIDDESEAAVLERIAEICEARLQEYDHTIEEDTAILDAHKEAVANGDTDSSSRLSNKMLYAIQYRREEKKVYRGCADIGRRGINSSESGTCASGESCDTRR
eukprot:TRINITY_DN64819_c0_g1_i1.p1 TRINITY_DN64819_c0_g1~~TRINITY_DN64819_c0_g1_i1.p1  ORF type:complete len:567 (-),score=60.43 TRINITY_DN64819_c0_g1_i1:48-1748(-)